MIIKDYLLSHLMNAYWQQRAESDEGAITIEDDVWIGMYCMILSGVTIRQGAVIGAGSIVRKDIPPYAVYAGGEIRKYCFEKHVIEKLLMSDFEKLDRELIQQYRALLYRSLDDSFFESELYAKIKRSWGRLNCDFTGRGVINSEGMREKGT